MKDFSLSPAVAELGKTAANMYRLGWDERNGGNISCLLDETEVAAGLGACRVIRRLPIGFDAKELAGRFILVTGTGKYFKNIEADPEKNLGLMRIAGDGKTAELLWGLNDGGGFTSELPAHLMSHISRLPIEPGHRVVMHCHPTKLLAMNRVHPLDERALTRTLWRMSTECIMVFPDGIGVLPWMLPGTREIGEATAKKLSEFRIVSWAMHGIYAAGKTLDEAFGLIETVEKAAEIYMLSAHLKELNTITDEQLRLMAAAYGVKAREDFLKDQASTEELP